ncbi:MAG: type II toxin-antitoxin system VapC family toxin [Polyangiaceae bacterium]|nr:type II toxin-antitoxin system VapC family toxin [Polyangiaceae bacterium]
MSLLLDTNICIGFLNQKDAKLKARIQRTAPGELRLCSVVKAELLFGARNGSRAPENLRRLDRFFKAFESLPFDDDAAHEYGLLRTELRRAGKPIGANDMLIAAIALAHRATLVTRDDDDFLRVPGLRVESW